MTITPKTLTELAPAPTPMQLLDQAIDKGASVETLERLLALQERWEKNQARKAFDNAMAAAKAEIPVIIKHSEVDFTSAKGRTHYHYEEMADIAREVGPLLAKHGLNYRYRTNNNANAVTVICVLSHRDGHSEENSLSAGIDLSGNKNSIQAIGSTVTYLQRYTLKAALGLSAALDDDAKAANKKGKMKTITAADKPAALPSGDGSPSDPPEEPADGAKPQAPPSAGLSEIEAALDEKLAEAAAKGGKALQVQWVALHAGKYPKLKDRLENVHKHVAASVDGAIPPDKY